MNKNHDTNNSKNEDINTQENGSQESNDNNYEEPVMLLKIAKIVTLMIMAILIIIIIKANHLATIMTAQINKTTQTQISTHLILMHQKLMLQKK